MDAHQNMSIAFENFLEKFWAVKKFMHGRQGENWQQQSRLRQ